MQRFLGRLIQEGQKNGEIRKQGDRNSNLAERKVLKLAELGITEKESHVFQVISKIPEEKFEAFITEKKTPVRNGNLRCNHLSNRVVPQVGPVIPDGNNGKKSLDYFRFRDTYPTFEEFTRVYEQLTQP